MQVNGTPTDLCWRLQPIEKWPGLYKRNVQVVMLTCEERKSDNWWMFMYYLFAGVDFDGCLDMFCDMNRKNQQICKGFFLG